MANQNYSEFPSRKANASTGKGSTPKAQGGNGLGLTIKTMTPPGLPGKAQPGNRSNGVPRCNSLLKPQGL